MPDHGIWLALKTVAGERRRWKRVTPDVDAFETRLWIDAWPCRLRIALFLKKVGHFTRKNFQLDLLSPDEGHWEYAAIATNKKVNLRTLWHFTAGRAAHEEVIGKLKSGYAFDAISTQNCAANSTWQILSTLAYNLVTNCQLATGAAPRPHILKCTAHHVLERIHTLRFELLHRAGFFQYPQGRPTFTVAHNLSTRSLFDNLVEKLAQRPKILTH